MKTLTKDQQKFWDILRQPYKHDCKNCLYTRKTKHGNKDCVAPIYLKLGVPCCRGMDGELINWRWDGKNN